MPSFLAQGGLRAWDLGLHAHKQATASASLSSDSTNAGPEAAMAGKERDLYAAAVDLNRIPEHSGWFWERHRGGDGDYREGCT